MGLLDIFQKPKQEPPRRRTAGDILREHSGTAEVFHFRENLTAAKGGPRFATKVPPVGHACVEVMDAAGNVLAMDVFRAPPAPRGAYKPNGVPATFVVCGKTGRAQQEFDCKPDNCPFPLPPHITGKENATTIRVWWNCDE